MEVDLVLQKELIDALGSLKGDSNFYDSPILIALFSGAFVLIGAYVTHLSNLQSERARHTSDLEIKKAELENRKQENILEKQLEALHALSKINHTIQPNEWASELQEIDDVYIDVVYSMRKLISSLNNFLEEYSYIIPIEIVTQVNVVVFKCNENHWGVTNSTQPGYEPSESEKKAARDVLKFLNLAVTDFKEQLGIINSQ